MTEKQVSPENPLWSVGTVAEMLDVTQHTVRQWIEQEALPARKIRGRWRVSKSDVIDFINKEYGND